MPTEYSYEVSEDAAAAAQAYTAPQLTTRWYHDFCKGLPSMSGKNVAITGTTSGCVHRHQVPRNITLLYVLETLCTIDNRRDVATLQLVCTYFGFQLLLVWRIFLLQLRRFLLICNCNNGDAGRVVFELERYLQ